MYAYIQNDIVLSKERGGHWGLKNLPEIYHGLIAEMLDSYCNVAEIISNTEVKIAFCKYMLNAICSNMKEAAVKYMDYQIIELRNLPKLSEKAAMWFHEKWGIPKEVYLESINESIDNKTGIPQWYLVLNEQEGVIAGAGVIDNDFHDRKDLTPNLCALFVEKDYRRKCIAKKILDFIRKDVFALSFENLYLITDHTDFYEKCGWTFLTMVKGDDGQQARLYSAK